MFADFVSACAAGILPVFLARARAQRRVSRYRALALALSRAATLEMPSDARESERGARPLASAYALSHISRPNGPSALLSVRIAWQCPNGHTLCDECSGVCRVCPSCRGTPCDIRCLALEKVGGRIPWPCRFADEGCEELLEFDEARAHFQECEYRPQPCCPFSDCDTKMTLDEKTVVRHLVREHGLKVEICKGHRDRGRMAIFRADVAIGV